MACYAEAEAFVASAQSAREQGALEEAVRLAATALADCQQHDGARTLLAELKAQQQAVEAAREAQQQAIEAARQARQQAVDAARHEARELAQAGSWVQAGQEWQRLIERLGAHDEEADRGLAEARGKLRASVETLLDAASAHAAARATAKQNPKLAASMPGDGLETHYVRAMCESIDRFGGHSADLRRRIVEIEAPRKAAERRRAAILIGAVVVLVVAGLLGWLAIEQKQARTAAPEQARATAAEQARVAEQKMGTDRPAIEAMWSRGPLPAGMRKSAEPYVYVWDTGKGLEIEMVYVAPGDFTMGSDGWSGQKPKHTHPMPKGYWIGRYETTWREYLAFCRATGRSEPTAPSWGKPEDHPVVNVSWDDAQAFCDWAGLALPTEAQWEKAARGTNGRKYPWGNEEPTSSRCVFRDAGSTKAVAGRPSGTSPYGAHDMAGNALEWTADWFDSGAYARYRRGDIASPSSGSNRILRGGGWYGIAWGVHAAYRDRATPSSRNFNLGLRPARVLP